MKKKLFYFLFCIVLFCSGCTLKQEPISRTDFVFDTVVTITIYSWEPETDAEQTLSQALQYCRSFEEIFSRTNPDSELYQLNHRTPGRNTITLSVPLAKAIQCALFWAEASDGALDITLTPVIDLWDFHTASPTLPQGAAVREALSDTGWELLQFDGRTLTLPNNTMQLDLGAIAKGYIADELKIWLQEHGVTSALINLGGNLLALGVMPDGNGFGVGIQKPFGGTADLAEKRRLTNQSLVTSGNYQRCFTINGQLYHHLLDPTTGWPCENGLDSVTILADSSMNADALSTACFVLGAEKGMALIEAIPGTEALFLFSDGSSQASNGWYHETK